MEQLNLILSIFLKGLVSVFLILVLADKTFDMFYQHSTESEKVVYEV